MPLVVVLVGGMVLIVLAADYFTNGIEWLGFLAHINEGATGSLLAAMGTALPETLVPVAAMYFGGSQPDQAIGLGAILGAPLMLTTLGFFVIGVGLMSIRQPRLVLSDRAYSLRSDLKFFLAAFAIAVAFTALPRATHRFGALALVLLYALHARAVLRTTPAASQAVKKPKGSLHLFRDQSPSVIKVLSQVAVALFGLMMGAHFFVQGLDQITARIRLSEFLLAVLITPIATELPEVFNSVIWLRHGRNALAVGNVSGAMAFQASVVPALGMVVTRWQLTLPELTAAAIAWIGALWVLWVSRGGEVQRRYLMASGVIYLGFLGVFWVLLH